MNAKAKEIGATHTHFVNANGMPDPDHYSTAEDMAKIAAYAMKNPKFRQLVGTREKQVHYMRPNETVTFGNTNELLYSYPGATGIKTDTPERLEAALRDLPSVTARNSSSSSCIPRIRTHASPKLPSFSTTASLLKKRAL